MYLANRLLLAQARQRAPDLFRQPLLPPLIILGLPRSGTTFLHRLLAVDPAHRAVPMWEMMRPLPGKKDRRRQRARRELRYQQQANPQLDRIHYVRADAPEECMFLLGLTFDSLVFWVTAPVYGYLEWLKSQDHLRAYREYRWLLHVLQAVAPTRRLALKAPAHTLALDALLQAVPNALLIQTHRDPVTICKSGASLIHSTQCRATDELDLPRMLEANFDLLERMIASNRAARAAHPGLVLDVHYEQLVADPVGTVRGIYQHFELPWSDVH
ncbi:MAG: sulfotransferase, partial [Delftia sp.]|nr:sulfotransferase [Delftia sp.]